MANPVVETRGERRGPLTPDHRDEPRPPAKTSWPQRLRRTMVGIAIALGVTVLMFALLEGLASTFLFGYRLYATRQRPLAERLHTTYDPLIGWVALPNVSIPDLYGPGVGLHTNALGLRGTEQIDPAVPAGRARVMCSGDSFTLGYGVDDEHTWCHLLSVADPRLQTLNLGQGGYGLDQAFLWYRRTGAPLAHDLHIFAYINGDFTRMRVSNYFGYYKPTLRLAGDSLMVERIPVPRRRFYTPWRTQLYQALTELRLVSLFGKVARRMAPATTVDSAAVYDSTWNVARKLFDEMARMNREKGSTMVFVHLPTQSDYQTMESEPWRRRMQEEADRRGWIFIDLVPALRALPATAVPPLFIQTTPLSYPAASGHYTNEGNVWVRDQLLQALRRRPEFVARMAKLSGTPPKPASPQ